MHSILRLMALAHELNIKDQDLNLSPESRGVPWGEIIRDYQPKATTKWRFGKPSYKRVNQTYFDYRSKKHPEGSLEEVVSKLQICARSHSPRCPAKSSIFVDELYGCWRSLKTFTVIGSTHQIDIAELMRK